MQASKTARSTSSLATLRLPPLHALLTIVAPLACIVLLLAIKALSRDSYRVLIREDGIFEDLSLLFYAGASAGAFAASFVLRQRGERLFAALYLILGLSFLYIAGEEISWGQRIFNIPSPEFFEQYNRQQELNTHNFLSRYKLHAVYIVFSAACAYAWLALPLVVRRLPGRLGDFLGERLWMLAPDRRLRLYFLPCLVLYIYIDYFNAIQVALYGPGLDIHTGNVQTFFIIAKDQEPVEMLLAAGLMLFTFSVLRQARRLPLPVPRA